MLTNHRMESSRGRMWIVHQMKEIRERKEERESLRPEQVRGRELDRYRSRQGARETERALDLRRVSGGNIDGYQSEKGSKGERGEGRREIESERERERGVDGAGT